MDRKKLIGFAIKAGFIVAVFVFLFRPQTFGASEDLFQGVTPLSILELLGELDAATALFWLGFAATIKLGGIFAGVLRWKLLLNGQGIKLPIWYLAKCWFMGRAIGLLLPGTVGLDGYRLVESAAHTGEVIKCTTVIAVEKLIGFISLGILVFLTLPLVIQLFEVNVAVLAVILAILLGFIATSFLLLLNPRIVQVLVAVVPVPKAIEDKVNKLGVAVTAYSSQRGTLLLAVVLGLCVHLGICLMYFGNAMAVTGGTSSISDVLFASPLVIVGSIIAPTVSGVGVREAVFGILLGAKYGSGAAILFGHLGLWVGEMVPFVLSIPLLLFATRPSREEFLSEVYAVQKATREKEEESLYLPPDLVRDYRSKLITCGFAGIFGGLIGGAIGGLAEAGWHISTLENYNEVTAFWWGPLFYGLAGVPLGIGVAAVLVFLYLLFNRFAPASVTFGLSLGGTLGALALVIGRFRYQRDVLAEQAMSLQDNLGVLGGAVGLALVAAVIGAAVVHFIRGGWPRAVAGGLVGYAAIVIIGFIIAFVGRPKAEAVAFSPNGDATGPNIILIAVDTLRADFLKAYNESARAATPRISELAGDSVLFDQAFAQSSWTKASFGTIFSGMYPEAHTATGKASALPDEITTFPEVLHEAGYFTKGYSNNPNITSIFNYHQGFTDYVDLKPDLYFGAKASCEKLVGYDVLRKVIQKGYSMLGGIIVITDFYQPAEAVTSRALDWLDGEERPEDSPFMLFLHYMDPHDPFRDPERPGKGYARVQMPDPDPEEYKEAFIRSYNHEIEYLDEHLGALLDGLKERGLYEDSLIVFTSDHGEEFHEHGGWWHGLSLYDEQIAIPYMLKLPGNELAGKKNPNLTRHVDLAPTLAQFAGTSPHDSWQGQSLFTEDLQPGNTDTTHVYGHLNFEGIILRALRSQQHKLIHANEGNKRDYAPTEFYDLTTDPGEQENLADDLEASDTIAAFDETMTLMQAFVEENAAEPALSEEAYDELQEELESLGYIE